jgi:rod shape-determining protein MreC
MVLGVLVLASLLLFTFYVREGKAGPLHTVQLGASEVLRPAQSVVDFVAGPIGRIGEGVSDVVNGEEQKLKQKAERSEELASQVAALERENERLRSLLQGGQQAYQYGPLARVISPVGEQFADRVVINTGKAEGIGPQQPVVVGDSTLVGRTTSRITAHTAEVMLITDQSFAAGARTVRPPEGQEEPSPGQLQGSGGGEGLLRTSWEDYLALDYVSLSADVKEGDFVMTSGRSEDRELIFPPGLLIGKVKSVSSQDTDQFKKIVVEPAVNPQEIEEVRVITDW